MIEEVEWAEPTIEELGMTKHESWKSVKPQEVINAIEGEGTPAAKQRMKLHEEFMQRWSLK